MNLIKIKPFTIIIKLIFNKRIFKFDNSIRKNRFGQYIRIRIGI